MNAPLADPLRLRVARLVLLVACGAALAAQGPGALGDAGLFVLAVGVLNLVLGLCARPLRVGYDLLSPVLDSLAALALIWLTGGSASPFHAVLVVPCVLAAWLLPSRSCGLLVGADAVLLAIVAPPQGGIATAAAFALDVGLIATTAGLTAWLRGRQERSRPNIAVLTNLPLSGRDPESAFRELGQAVSSLLRARAVFLLRPNGRGGLRVANAPLDLESDAVGAADGLPTSQLVLAAVRARRVVLAANAHEDARIEPALAQGLNARSLLAGPIYARGALEGVVVAMNGPSDPPFDDEDLALTQLAIATVVASRFAENVDPIYSLLGAWPDPLVLLSLAGQVLDQNPAAAAALREDLTLSGMLADAAEATLTSDRLIHWEDSQVCPGWGVEALRVNVGAQEAVLARLVDVGTGGDSALRWLSASVPQAIDAPARAVRDYAQALVRDAAGEPATVRSLAEHLLDQAMELHHAIEELLALSLSRLTAENLRIEAHDLSRLVLHAAEAACAREAVTVRGLDALPALTVPSDEAVLGRSLEAMFSSLCALTPDSLDIGLGVDEGWAVLRVTLGRAIPTRVRQRITRPFVQVGEGKGFGIGIWLARHVTRLHGGDLRLSDEGRLIQIVLPRGPVS